MPAKRPLIGSYTYETDEKGFVTVYKRRRKLPWLSTKTVENAWELAFYDHATTHHRNR